MSKKIFEIQKVVISALLLVIISLSSTGIILATNTSVNELNVISRISSDNSEPIKDQQRNQNRLETIPELIEKLESRKDSLVYHLKDTILTNDLAETFNEMKEKANIYTNNKTTENRLSFRNELKIYATKYLQLQKTVIN